MDIIFYLELSEELKKKGWKKTFSGGFNPAWKAMKQQHCLHFSFLLVVIKACKVAGVDTLKISRAIPCTLASSTLAFLQAEFFVRQRTAPTSLLMEKKKAAGVIVLPETSGGHERYQEMIFYRLRQIQSL